MRILKLFVILISFLTLLNCGNKRTLTQAENNKEFIVLDVSKQTKKKAIIHTEGWVKVKFTITKTGTVKSPVVIESNPKNIFDQEAIRALLKYKFKPKFKHGKAVEQHVTQIIEFKLAKE